MKIKFFLVSLLLSFFVANFLYSVNIDIPANANKRLDIYRDTAYSETGKWVEISRYKTSTGADKWGQYQCLGTGNECHRFDWFTWWVPELVEEPDKSEPESDYDFEYPNSIPIEYNTNTGEYIY